jgi:hypothetical protein
MTRRRDDDELDATDVVAQVEKALDAIQLGLGPLRDALPRGVREGLGAARDEEERGATRGDNVVDLDPGRAEAEPNDGPEGTVRVFRADRVPPSRAGRAPLGAEGRIRCRPDPVNPWQTVYRGDPPRPYRLLVSAGALELSLDGVVVERLIAGQSIDIEARLIRVRSVDDDVALGSYVRLFTRGK